ncbi:helix-turn-helix domain-containing protein [Oceanicola sp. D3]|uniref:IclR family transcriptional regulator domain-containing protein n=1 Tax=Oceanicola sp. D3 TaxID=2587163 RepID=UPI00112138E1|nr:helix-turn-helix domain-containing protein [Oceanicola sp. D3]QDC10045.1 helix-turn-helix domain-containing protein [Oceanicola sp. D3]
MPETIQSLSRGLRVLTLINQRGAVSLADLHHATGFSRPAILRLLATLEAEGFIRRWLDDGLYRVNTLSPGNNRNIAWLTLVADTIGPSLSDLTDQIGWPVDVAVLDGDKMTLCETTRRQSQYPVDLITSGYQVHLLQSAVGRAYLSFIGKDDRTALLGRLSRSTDPYDALARDREKVEAIVEEVRSLGYATRSVGYSAQNTTYAGSMRAIAVPVYQDGTVAACLSVAWTATYMDAETFAAKHLATVHATAREASHVMESARAKTLSEAHQPTSGPS